MKYHIEFDIDFKRNTYPGKLIAIEGIDGSGKTLQAKKLTEGLEKKGITVFATKNPTDGKIGKFIRRVLAGEVKLPPVSFQYLFSADRQVQQVELLQRLEKGEYIVTDRYFWSALAYGVVDRSGEDLDFSSQQLLVAQGILSHYHQFIVPDKTFYLEISVDTALSRLNAMGKDKEIYESREQLTKIKNAYEFFIKKFPGEFTIINGEKSVEEVTKEIIEGIKTQ